MPFESDKQRRYLWSQKPEVAKQIAYKQDGGKAESWWNKRMAGVRQDRGHTDDLDQVRAYYAKYGSPAGDMSAGNWDLSKPRGEGGAYWNVPVGYTPQYRASVDEEAARVAHNAALKAKADQIGFKFNEGGDVPEMDNIKKVTQKDRYGNQVSYEFESPVKPIDQTAIIKEMMQGMGDVPEMEMQIPMMDHPGEPKGTDIVPAWLTPGEFVVNKEATEIYGDEIKQMNDHGREIQKQKKGGQIDADYYSNGRRVSNRAKHKPALVDDPIRDISPHDRWKGVGRDLAVGATSSAISGIPLATLAYLLSQKDEINPIGDYGITGPELYREDGGDVQPQLNPLLELYSKLTGIGQLHEQRPAEIIKIPEDVLKEKQGFFYQPEHKAEGGWITDALLDRLAEVESGGNNKAVSPAGAVGKYQWLPTSAKQAGYGVKAFDPLDEVAARKATAQYLKNMQKHHGFTPEETLRAYNWGPGNVLKHKKGTRKDIPDEALNYPGKILGFDKVEGVPAPADMPTPTARPEGLGMPEAIPTPRPEQEQSGWKDFFNKYVLGPKTQYAYDGKQIPHLDTLASEYQEPSGHKIHPEIKTGGHQMFGGNQNIAGEVVPQGPPEKEIPWYNSLLGPNLKDESTLTDQDKDFLDNQTKTSELLAADQLAEEENQIAGPNEIESVEDAIIESVQNESVNNNIHAEEIKTEAYKDKEVKDEVKKDIVKKVDEQTKDAGNIDADDKTIEDAAKKDPGTVEKAEGFLKGILGDLFDTKELKRAAVMYAGSRLLGYGHQGSLRHIMKNYVTRIDAKANARQDFIKSNAKNYTAASLQQYKESGDLTSLVPIGTPANRTGEFKTFYGPSGAVKAEKIKVGKNTMWSTDGGKTFIDGTKFNGDPAYVKGTKENKTMVNNFITKTTDQLKSLRGQFDRFEIDDNVGYKTDINPATSAGKIADWAVKNNVKPEELSGLVESAYHDAINDKRQDGAKPRSIVPYLNQLIIRQKTGNPDLFLAKGYDPEDKGAKQYINAQKLQTLNKSVAHIMKSKGLQGGTQDLSNQFYNAAVRDWNKLSTKEQEKYIGTALDDESGFYKFIEAQALKYAQ